MLKTRLHEYISACFTGIWIESHEHQDALEEIAQLCRAEGWRLTTWDIDQGLRQPGQAAPPSDSGASDPRAAIRSLSSLASSNGAALLVLMNFHRFLGSAEIIQALIHQIT